MTGLRELFEEAVSSSPRPSRLVADEVYAAGRRWRRRRLTVATCATATALAAVVTAGVNLLAPAVAPVDEPPPTAGWTTPARGVDSRSGQRIQWAAAADAQHLYQAYSTCLGSTCKTIVQLIGSDDGGRTWSERGTPMNIASLAVLGPDTLIAAVFQDQPGADTTTVMTSVDGGRTWATTSNAPAVNAVPSGGTAICWRKTTGSSCTLHVVDPASHQIAPLAEQPALTLRSEGLRIEESGGRLWVGGTDRATGRPAITVSADAGRTWSTQVFADAPPCPREGCAEPSLAVDDRATVYAVTTGERDWAVYRRADDAGWQRITGADHVPYQAAENGSFVTADGTHVLYQLEDRRNADGYRFWAATDGGAYRLVELDGLPATAGPVRRTPDGWFYALNHADDVLYGSTDGWHWSPATRR